MAYRTVQHSLTEKQTKLKKILDIPDDDKMEAHAQEMQDRIADYLKITSARLKIDSIKQVRWELKWIFWWMLKKWMIILVNLLRVNANN